MCMDLVDIKFYSFSESIHFMYMRFNLNFEGMIVKWFCAKVQLQYFLLKKVPSNNIIYDIY